MSANSQTDGSDVIKLLYDSLMRSARTSVVVRVEAYNAGECSADVTTMVQEERKIDGEYVPIPASRMSGCPVVFWGGGGNSFIGGLSPGDLCLGLYRHRSHDEIDNGDEGPLVPESTRRLDMADIIVIGTFTPPANGLDSSQYRTDGQPVLAMPEVSALHVGDSSAQYVLVRHDLLRSYLFQIQIWLANHIHNLDLEHGATFKPTIPPPTVPADMSSPRIKVDK